MHTKTMAIERLVLGGLVISLAAALGGCFNGSIDVSFEVPPTGPDIASLELVVYAEASGPLSCDALSFDDIPADVLQTTQVFAGVAGPDESLPVSGVPRKGKKLFFAEAKLANGVSVYAGCAEVGEIEGPTVVEIEPFLRTNSTFRSRLARVDGNGGTTLGNAIVRVVRLDGVPLANDPVKWRLRGAGVKSTFELEGEAITESSGQAIIELSDARPAFGPVELEVRTRWAQSQAQPLTGLLEPRPHEQAVATIVNPAAVARGNDILEVGRFADNPLNTSIVVLAAEDTDGMGREQTFAHVFEFDASQNQLNAQPPIPVGDHSVNRGARTLGKVRSGTTDAIVTVYLNDSDDERWVDIGERSEKAAPFTGLPVKLGASGGCTDGAEELMFAQVLSDGRNIQVANASGDGVSGTFGLEELGDNLELVEIGCVRDTLNRFRNVFVVDPDSVSIGDPFAPFIPAVGLVSPGKEPGEFEVLTGGLSSLVTATFTGEFSETAEGNLLFGEATDEGPATTRYRMQEVSQQTVSVDFQGADPTPSVVIATAEGDINGDGESDVVSLVLSSADLIGPARVRLHISMAIPGSESRLRGTMEEPLLTVGPRLRLADVNNDGIDDIVVGSTDVVRVYVMGLRSGS